MTTATEGENGKPKLLVAGLGNLLLQDDGVGVHAVRELQQAPPPGVLAVEIGAAVLDALHLLEGADRVLVIDAMQAGEPPGTLYLCRDADIANPGVTASLHELSLMAALGFIPEARRPEIRVLGVEPETIDYGLDLTPTLRAALPRVVAAARRVIADWLPA